MTEKTAHAAARKLAQETIMIYTIRTFDSINDRCHIITGHDKRDVLSRAKQAPSSRAYFEVEEWWTETRNKSMGAVASLDKLGW
jgi:hypothetical protein